MNKLRASIIKNWYLYIIGGLLGLQALVFLIFREESYLQIHDNLDLFMAHYQMIKLNGGWYAQNVTMPMLHGIDRDLLGSEFLLYNFLYIIFPGVWAYLAGYALKILIGIWSFNILFKDILRDKYEKYRPLVLLTATAYGLIPVFPTYGIAFTSVPFIIFILRRLYIGEEFSKIKGDRRKLAGRILLYLAVFCYPVFSYFSYHGFFILCYMCLAVLILWVRDRKFPKSIFLSVCILSLGYMAFEYRLFKSMLFDDTVTIRTTMNHGDLSFLQALRTAFEEFLNASFHNQDSHSYLLLYVAIIGLVLINVGHIRRKEGKLILKDPANLLFLWIVFNCLIFGFYQYTPFRHLVETLVPKLTGFEFARTAYFNTFVWYALLLVLMIRLYDSSVTKIRFLAPVITVSAVLIVMFVPQVYNDFYYTCYNQAYKLLLKKDTSTVNYREFYSSELFDKVKEDMHYEGEWSVAYGFHPAVLQYNGIATLDGYLGMYPEEYKQKWLKVEAPAFENSPSLRDYFEGWGARVSIYSGSDENTYAALRKLEISDDRLMVDMDELRDLECRYIFSRIAFSNSEELGIRLLNSYSDESSPYVIYVYVTE